MAIIHNLGILVAFTSKKWGIGKDGAIPWHIPNDLKRFAMITRGHIVVMGRKTWDSLPKKPLDNRLNVVVTRTPDAMVEQGWRGDVLFVTPEEVDGVIATMTKERLVFVIGGTSLYRRYLSKAERVWATVIEGEFDCDCVFPVEAGFSQYVIEDGGVSDVYESDDGLKYRYINYVNYGGRYVHGESAYLDTMCNILKRGNRRDDRTGTGTVAMFGPQLRFDISQSYPLLTTKFVAWKTMMKELLFFLKGGTDTKLLEAEGVNIWKGNTSREFLDKRALTHYREGDMGPMYFWVVRHIGAKYRGADADYSGEGRDTLVELIKGLKEDPYSRRHLLSTYCPLYNDQGVLLPCHGLVVQFFVEADARGGKHLSCMMVQRSADTFLGLPFNIASYAALTYIIAKMCDMMPKELVINTGDCHLYTNHLDQARLQLSRQPLPFPQLRVADCVRDKAFEDITLDDFELVGYLHHPGIKAEMAV